MLEEQSRHTGKTEKKAERGLGKRDKIIVSVCVAILLVCVVTVAAVNSANKTLPNYSGQNADSVQYNPNAGEQLGSVPDTTSTGPQSAPAPTTLLDISGQGTQSTQPFTTTGDWNIKYTFDCSNFGEQGNFQIFIQNKDGSLNTDTPVNDLAANGGKTDYYYDAGQHYLEINSECNWHVTVTG